MDFETMIREARDNGVSIDDIAKMFSKTLNAVQQEEQKQNSVANKRKVALEHLEDTFCESISKNQLDCSDAAALFTLTMAEKYTDWTAEDIEDFFGTIQMTARTAAELIGKSPEEMFGMILGKSKDILDDVLKPVVEKAAPIKSKDNEKKTEAIKSDDDKIAEFLKLFD